MSTAQAVTAAINASMSVAADVAEGRLAPAQLTAEAVEACRALVGTVAGPDDALWPLQLDIARQVLGAGGIPAGELAEWLAVTQTREPVTPAVHDDGMSSDVQATAIDDAEIPVDAVVDVGLPMVPPSAEVQVYPPGAPLPPGSVVDAVPESWSDEPIHTLGDDCPCGPTVVTVPAGHRERRHMALPVEAVSIL